MTFIKRHSSSTWLVDNTSGGTENSVIWIIKAKYTFPDAIAANKMVKFLMKLARKEFEKYRKCEKWSYGTP